MNAHAIVFTRAGRLNITPAVPRYINVLRSGGFAGSIVGIELVPRTQKRSAVADRTFSFWSLSNGRSTLQRAISLFRWQFDQVRILAEVRPEIIQICDVFSVLPALLAKAFGARLVFDIRDNIGPSISHRSRLAALLLGQIEAIGARAADAVVVVLPERLNCLPEVARRKTKVILNTPSIEILRFSNERPSAETSELLLNVSGHISARRNIAAIVDAVSRCSWLHVDAYGEVADPALSASLKSRNFAVGPPCAHAVSLQRMSNADAVALMYDPSVEINRLAAPNKYYESLALGIPVICAEGMSIATEVRETDCGVVVAYGDPVDLSNKLEHLRAPEIRRRMSQAARTLFEDRYRGAAERSIRELYTELGLLPTRPKP